MLALASSCEKLNLQRKPSDEVLAKVYEKHLYLSEVKRLFPSGISAKDSMSILKNYIDKWVKTQLLVQLAELNLSQEQKDVSKQLEDYRSSLLIYKYEEQYIKMKLDTSVSFNAIEAYYAENSQSFKLSSSIVKASYIKMPNASPYVDGVKKIYRSTKEEDLKKLDSYCYQSATKYDFFDDNWVEFKEILKLVPYDVPKPESYLKRYSYIETKDSLFSYFVHIRDYELKGNDAPVEFVSNRIKSIILNKRKIKILSDLQHKIYNDALNKNQLVVY